MDLYEDIYFSLIGELIPEAALPWVPNAFVPGSPCAKALEQLYDAKYRLQERLNTDDDPDIEEMMSAMDMIQQELCIAVMKLRRM